MNQDPLDVVNAAPEHHRVIFENEQVRVLDTAVRAGESVPLHRHSCPGVAYYLSTSDFVRYDAEGKVDVDSRQAGIDLLPGSVAWLPPSKEHSIENVGDSDFRAIVVELKGVGGE